MGTRRPPLITEEKPSRQLRLIWRGAGAGETSESLTQLMDPPDEDELFSHGGPKVLHPFETLRYYEGERWYSLKSVSSESDRSSVGGSEIPLLWCWRPQQRHLEEVSEFNIRRLQVSFYVLKAS